MLSPDPWTPVIAAALVAFLPGFLFLSAFVTNDNLVNTLGALLTVVALWSLASPSTTRLIALGAVLGLTVITKLSALPTLTCPAKAPVAPPATYRGWGSSERGPVWLLALSTWTACWADSSDLI